MIEHPFFMENYFKYAPLVPALTKAKKSVAVVGVPNDMVVAGEEDETSAGDDLAGGIEDLGAGPSMAAPPYNPALAGEPITGGGFPLPAETGGGFPLPISDPGEAGQTVIV
jgi:hypothetical protein